MGENGWLVLWRLGNDVWGLENERKGSVMNGNS